jgi:single-strand DNA-binding protein
MSIGINKAILIGRLGKDPEIRTTTNNTIITSFSLATSELKKTKDGHSQEHVEWHNIVAFGKTAEIINSFLRKGAQVYIEGRLKTRSWDDNNGNKKIKTEIVVNTIQFLGNGRQQNNEYAHPLSPTTDFPVWRKKRNIRQNKLYWMWIRCIADQTGNDSVVIHNYCKAKFLKSFIVQIGKKNKRILPSSRILDTKAFAEYMTKVQQWANSELSIRLPTPDDFGYEQFELHYYNE